MAIPDETIRFTIGGNRAPSAEFCITLEPEGEFCASESTWGKIIAKLAKQLKDNHCIDDAWVEGNYLKFKWKKVVT